jgi:hypothetical protein
LSNSHRWSNYIDTAEVASTDTAVETESAIVIAAAISEATAASHFAVISRNNKNTTLSKITHSTMTLSI